MLDLDDLKFFAPFSEFDQKFLLDAQRHITLQQAPKGTLLFKRGRTLTDKYFLIQGTLSLVDSDFNSSEVRARSVRAAEALNTERLSNVSAIAKTPVIYFSVSASELERLVKHWRNPTQAAADADSSKVNSQLQVCGVEEEADWMSCLLKSPLFELIPTALIQALFLKFETVQLSAGDMVMKEGAKGDFFYVLASGEAKIFDRSGSIDVAVMAGDYFGEESLISAAPRNASVQMLSDGVLKRLDTGDFTSLVKGPVLQYMDPDSLGELTTPYTLLDIRMPIEYRTDHLPNSVNIPLTRLRASLSSLVQSRAYLVSERGGRRAEIAAYLLCQAGFDTYILRDELPSQGTKTA